MLLEEIDRILTPLTLKPNPDKVPLKWYILKKSSKTYESTEYTIEWHHDAKGLSPALAYFRLQSQQKQRKLLNLFRLMGDQGKLFNETKFRNEGEKIYALKPQPDRYLCFFFRGKKIIVTNAFTKKTQKLPQGEKELALKAYESYEKRIKKGEYYEEES